MTDLDVLIHGRLAGTVSEARGRRATFVYSDEYLASASPVPLSVSIPLGEGPYDVEAWLDGLLSDNDQVRRRWASDYGTTSTRPTVLLGTPVGRDCAGAVQFCRPADTDAVMNRTGVLHPLTEPEIDAIIADLRTDATGWNKNRTHTAFSLGGAQSKTALRFDAGQWSLPAGAACTTHILKPAAVRFPDLDVVEHLCQQAARNLGIRAASTECVYFGDQRALVVARYDRARLPDGEWRRVHQEDMCQALGVPPDQKYQSEGGPAPSDIAGLVRRYSTNPEVDVRQFLDGLIYNWLIVNTDGHAKNYSLMIDGGQVRFAPLYDLCSILPYKVLDGRRLHVPKLKLAMKVGKDYTLRKTGSASAWARAADQLGVSLSSTADRIGDLSDRIVDAFTEAIDTLPAQARALPCVADLRQGVALRSVEGVNVSQRAAKTPQKPPKKRSVSARSSPLNRCPHIGVRSRERCKLTKGHESAHRYQ